MREKHSSQLPPPNLRWRSLKLKRCVEAESLLALYPTESRALFAPAEGPARAGVGRVAEIRATGEARFDVTATFLETLSSRSPHGELPVSPFLLGGFSFDPIGDAQQIWNGFDDARFFLPRLSLVTEAGESVLLLAVDHRLSDQEADAELLSVAARLDEYQPPEVKRPQIVEEHSSLSAEAWKDYVSSNLDAIAAGSLHKIVAARCVELHCDHPIAPLSTFRQMASEAPACARFLFGFEGRRHFIGASPEILLQRKASQITTEALAGSCSREEDPDEHLLGNAKELREHLCVRDEIIENLRTLGLEAHYADKPIARRFSQIYHLNTPIAVKPQASNSSHPQSMDMLQIVRALHPTPAVAGLPRREAMNQIRSAEPVPRGWYAGAVGCFCLNGDMELRVALRSAILDGVKAHLFVGAGIVAGSVPQHELAETELKSQSVRQSLRYLP